MSEVITEGTFFNGVIADIAEINPRTDIALAEEERVSFLPMQNTSESGDIIALQERVFAQVSKGYTRFAENDVLVAKITPCFENGKGGYAKGLLNGIGFGSTEFHIVRAIPGKADSRFLHHLTRSERFRKAGEGSMTGSAGQKRIPSNFIKDFPIFIPPLPEQKKIAEILSGIDNLIANKEKQISILTTLQKSVLDALVEDQVSSGAPCLELSEVISPDRKITYGIVQAGPDTPGGIPYIRVTDMAGDKLETNAMLRTTKELANKFKRSEVQEGDVVVALRGIIGASHLIDQRTAGCNLTQGTALLSSSDKCDPRYMNAILKSEYCQNQFSFLAKGSTIIEITLSSLGTLRIPLPGRDSQEKITHIVDAMQRDIKHGKTILDSYKKLKIALASELLSGRKRVREDRFLKELGDE